MPVGAAIGGSVLGAGASIVSGNKAAKAQTQAADRAADVQLEMYNQTREDQAPYRQVGQGALYKLADMYGVSRPVASPPAGPSASTGPSLDAQITRLLGYGADKSGQAMQAYAASHADENPQSRLANIYALADGSERANFDNWLSGAGQGVYGAMSGQPTQMTEGYEGWQQSPGYDFRRDEAMKAIQRMGSARGARFSPQTWKAGARYADNLASSEYENYANALRSMAGIGQTSTSQTGALGVQTGQGIASQIVNAGNARASSYANTGAAINNFANNTAYGFLSGQFGGGGGASINGMSGAQYAASLPAKISGWTAPTISFA